MESTRPQIALPPELLDAVADRVADLVVERLERNGRPEPWLNTQQAADHLACPTSRIHDLTERGVLVPHRDGKRLLFKREQLDSILTDNNGTPRAATTKEDR